jgi:hypothetical protein
MAKGFGSVAAAKADIEKRRNSGGGGNWKKKLYLADGESATVRILEEGDDVTCYWAHPVDMGKRYPTLVPCRDQDMETGERIGEDCPGCEEGLKRRFRLVLNVIWRDGPVYEKDEATGKIDFDTPSYNEDHVCLAEFGSEFAEDLQLLEDDYSGLKSRDWKISRRGAKLDTKYSIRPAVVDGGATPLSKEDKILEENKYDLNEVVAAPAYEIWGKAVGKKEEDNTPSEASAFLRKRR